MDLRVLSPEDLERLLKVQPATAELFVGAPDAYLLDLLASIDRALLDRLMVERAYTAGTVIFEEGQPGDTMCLIRAGRVIVAKGDLAATPTILAYRGPGEIVGEMSLLESRPRSASVVAIEGLRMLQISRDSFQELLSANPSVGMSIMASLSARLRAADTVRNVEMQVGQSLIRQVTELRTEKEQLLEVQRLREETSHFIIHDLRNPLGIMMGVVHVLAMVLPPEILAENEKLLDAAKASGARMQLLVDALLDVARLEAGETRFNLAPTDVRGVVQKGVKRLAPTLTLSEIKLVVDVPANLPPVLADEEMLDRVLTNLVDNAVKYTPNAGTITVAAELREGQYFISINDTGPGIRPEERARIFQRFAQVAGDSPRRRGFGLGLTFCQLVVEGHGGRIWVEEGNHGVGSKFIFTLPAGR